MVEQPVHWQDCLRSLDLDSRRSERAVMLTLGIIGAVVLPILALVAYVVRKSEPGRFRLSATLLKAISIDIEVDAQSETDKLSPTVARLGITDTPLRPDPLAE